MCIRYNDKKKTNCYLFNIQFHHECTGFSLRQHFNRLITGHMLFYSNHVYIFKNANTPTDQTKIEKNEEKKNN